MSVTITHSAGVIEPLAVSGYASTRRSNNIIHTIPGNSIPDVTLRPASLRTGTLTLVFGDEVTAAEAEHTHAIGGVFTLTSSARTTVSMAYVLSGDLTRELAPSGQWNVTVGYQEVAP